MATVLRTRTIDESRGFMKALIETDGDHILGFTMIGPEAGEVMAVVQMAMLAGLPYTALRDAILTHPTMAEGLNSLFSSVKQANAGAASREDKDWSALADDFRTLVVTANLSWASHVTWQGEASAPLPKSSYRVTTVLFVPMLSKFIC